MKSKQYTLRQVPEKIDTKLRSVAASRGISLDEAAIDALAKGLGVDGVPVLHHDLDEFLKTWQEDPEFDEAMRIFEMVDESLWK
ncbi:MAG: hypothetical protein ABIU29_09530 [Chthoniobacterales bacterium]